MSALLPMLRLLLALATIPLAAIAVLPLVERLPSHERRSSRLCAFAPLR